MIESIVVCFLILLYFPLWCTNATSEGNAQEDLVSREVADVCSGGGGEGGAGVSANINVLKELLTSSGLCSSQKYKALKRPRARSSVSPTGESHIVLQKLIGDDRVL